MLLTWVQWPMLRSPQSVSSSTSAALSWDLVPSPTFYVQRSFQLGFAVSALPSVPWHFGSETSLSPTAFLWCWMLLDLQVFLAYMQSYAWLPLCLSTLRFLRQRECPLKSSLSSLQLVRSKRLQKPNSFGTFACNFCTVNYKLEGISPRSSFDLYKW